MDVEREAHAMGARVNCEEASSLLSRARLLRGMLDREARRHLEPVASTSRSPADAVHGHVRLPAEAFVLSFHVGAGRRAARQRRSHALALCPGPVPTGFQAAASIPSGAVLSFAKLDAQTVVERALDAYARRIVLEDARRRQQRANARFKALAALA